MAEIKQYQQRVFPSVGPVSRRAEPFAVSEPLAGPGTAALGRGLRDLTGALVERADEQARIWASTTLSKARLDWTTNLVERVNKSEPGAPDLTSKLLSDYDEYSNKVLASAPNEASRSYLTGRLADLGASLGERSIAYEAAARVDWRADQFDQTSNNLSQLMNKDPSQYGTALAEHLAVIDASDMPPVKKSAVRQKAIDRVSTAAVWSQIQKSPGAFLDSIGFGAPVEGKIRQSSGFLDGPTGNLAFDALPFERRTQMFDHAIREKARIDADLEKLSTANRNRLADDGMKEAWDRLFSGRLDLNFIESIRPVIRENDYKSLREALRNGGADKDDRATFRQLQGLIYANPDEAERFAYQAHRSGLLTNGTLSTALARAREISRTEGPKSEYERSRNFVRESLDPGPMVPDPVGRSRLADALDVFDRWFLAGQGKRTDKEIEERGREIVDQYKFISFQEEVLALPQPRGTRIRRQTADVGQMNEEIRAAGRLLEQNRDARKLTQAEYEAEMRTLLRWKRAAERAGVK